MSPDVQLSLLLDSWCSSEVKSIISVVGTHFLTYKFKMTKCLGIFYSNIKNFGNSLFKLKTDFLLWVFG